jgi:diadenosine tetraphosphatase ApaH/serine/threonine PP2A family protein phosphatase
MRPILAKQIAFMLDEIGPERLAWLRALTLRYSAHNLTVVHATPTDAWGIVPHDAPDEQLERVFAPLGTPRVVYGHIHRSFVRPLPTFVLANSGCVSLSYDGDPRAAYAVLDNHQVTIRRVEYDIGRETAALKQVRFPYASWMAEMLRNGYVPPPAVEDVE